MTATLDFFYYFGSTYTYLTVMRIEEMAAAAGVEVRWRPFNVRAIMIEMDNTPFRNKPIKTPLHVARHRAARRPRRPSRTPGSLSTRSSPTCWPAGSGSWPLRRAGARPTPRRAIAPGSSTTSRSGCVPNVAAVLRGLGKDPGRDHGAAPIRTNVRCTSYDTRDRCRTLTRHLRLADVRRRWRNLLGRRSARGYALEWCTAQPA